jgi:hypothetical protein
MQQPVSQLVRIYGLQPRSLRDLYAATIACSTN